MEWVKDLYDNHRVWFWVLIPIVAVIWISNALGGLQKLLAQLTIKRAEKEDEKLKLEEQKLASKVAKKEATIESKEDAINERKPEDIPLDWHTRFKPKDK